MFISLDSIQAPTRPGLAAAERLKRAERFLPAHLSPKRPTTYTLELMAACDHQCVGCGNVFGRQMKFLRGTAWRHILEKLRDDIISLRITGGECTLHPDFEMILRAVDALGAPFVVFTNGRWGEPSQCGEDKQQAKGRNSDKRGVDKLLSLFASCKHLDGLLISLHGHTAATYREFVVTDSFATVTDNIRRAAQASIRVGTNTLLLQSTSPHIAEIVALSLSLGASSVAFSRYYGEPMADLELSEEELQAALGMVAALRQTEPRVVFNNCVPLCFSDGTIPTKGCTSGFTHCTIDPSGVVRPCTHSPFTLGQILEQDITTIWASDRLRQWRDLIPSGCHDCGAFGQCRGGCRATAYQQSLAQDPLIRAPLPPSVTAEPERFGLYRHARPVRNYTLRQDHFGFYLVNRNRHLAVSAHALPILDLLDGQTTLEQIHSRLGQVALDFIGSLMLSGLVKLDV